VPTIWLDDRRTYRRQRESAFTSQPVKDNLMAYFDATLDFAPVNEQDNTPVLPEDRFVFELVGLERSEPDTYRKNGGIRWTWRVFLEDGRTPFVWQDEQYLFFRTTGVDAKGRPSMSVGTYAHTWASAMLGRELALDETLSPSELRGARMSAMVIWEPQKTDPKKKTVKLASLRHVPKTGAAPEPAIASVRVDADATAEDVDHALAVSKLVKKIERAKRKKMPKADLAVFENAYEARATASSESLNAIIDNLDDALDVLED
jgi:hypothetical protein